MTDNKNNKNEPKPELKQGQHGLEIAVMKSGDYMVHVLIEYAKNMNFYKDPDVKTFNPVLQINCGEQKQYSSTKKDFPLKSSEARYWGEHFFFEPKNVSSEDISGTQLTISVLDKGFFRDQILGMFDIDLQQIYFQNEDHSLHNKWIAITNPDSDEKNEVKGYLMVSISVQGPGDNAVKLASNDAGLKNETENVLMPASVKKIYKQLSITICEAHHLPKMDTIGTIDAYLYLKYNDFVYKTQVRQPQNSRCGFYETFQIPITWPSSKDSLKIEVWDDDPGNDEIVGCIDFSIRDLVQNCSNLEGQFKWRHIYGSHTGVFDGPYMNLMNYNPEIASHWKGRVLFHLKVEDSKAPLQQTSRTDNSIIQMLKLREWLTPIKYQFKAEIGAGICLPGNEKYKIGIQAGAFHILSDAPKEYKKKYARWGQRFDTKEFESCCQSLDELDRIYIYLQDGDTKLCFWRGQVKDFASPNPDFQWLAFSNDRAVGKVSHLYDAGFIQIKLSFSCLKENPKVEYNQIKSWMNLIPKALDKYVLRCFIFQCRDLPTADENSQTDAYISVWQPNDTEKRTKTVQDSNNPIFYEVLDVQIDLGSLETAHPIVLFVWDEDEGLIEDSKDYVGCATIPMMQANIQIFGKQDKILGFNRPNISFSENQSEFKKVPKPQWHDIRYGFKESFPATGQILCSFQLVEQSQANSVLTPAQQVNISNFVKTNEYDIDINVLSMSNLQSSGILPVRKPFISFSIKSLLPPDQGFAVENIQTAPKATGNNPIINQVISFETELPFETIYCPKLSCEVFDFICKGLSQPVLGTFDLDIGEIMHRKRQRKAYMLDLALQQINHIEDLIKKQPQFTGVVGKDDDYDDKVSVAKSLGYEDQEINVVFGRLAQSKKAKKKKTSTVRKNERLAADINEINLQIEGELIQEEDDAQSTKKLMPKLFEDHPETEEEESKNQINSKVYQSIESAMSRFKIVKQPQQNQEAFKLINDMVTLSILEQTNDFTQRRLEKSQKINEIFAQAENSEEGLKALQDQLQSVETKVDTKKQIEDIKQQLLKMVISAKHQRKTVSKKTINNKKRLATLTMIEEGHPIFKTVIYPKYIKDERLGVYREEYTPPASLYMGIGYDGKLNFENQEKVAKNRHYRKFYDDELENNKEIFKESIFYHAKIMRGQNRGLSEGFFQKLFSSPSLEEVETISSIKQVGEFKGFIQIKNKEEELRYQDRLNEMTSTLNECLNKLHQKQFGKPFIMENNLVNSTENRMMFRQKLVKMGIFSEDLVEFYTNQHFDDFILQQVTQTTQCMVRLYVLEAFDLASRDIGSDSDPYLFIKCGPFKYNGQDKYKLDESNPKFHEAMEFNVNFPGAPNLVIELWDFDDLFGDDLIGRTVIDLDERQFCPNWRALDHKPVEYRELYHESSSMSQGSVVCWVEIEEATKKKNVSPILDIKPEPVSDYQLRVAVYSSENFPKADQEGTSDLFCKVLFNNEVKETDTHWRATGATANWNYRVIFDFQQPSFQPQSTMLRLQLYDRDIFSANDFLCEFSIDLELLVQDCRLTHKPMQLSKKYWESYFKAKYLLSRSYPKVDIEFEDEDSFWLQIKLDTQSKPVRLLLDIRVLPGVDAKNQAVGVARSQPNHSPHLKEPLGRFKFTMNPIDMISQLLGPELRNKCLAYMSTIICLSLCVVMSPMILSGIISQLIMKLFGY